MGLADYQPETRVIPLKNSSFEVRGLSLEDFTTLVRHHLPDLEALYDLGSSVLGGKVDPTNEDLTKLAIVLSEQAPGFVSNLIALAAGDHSEKAVAAARTIAFPLQVKTLVDIAELTFDEVGGIKKAMEFVVGLRKNGKAPTTSPTTDP